MLERRAGDVLEHQVGADGFFFADVVDLDDVRVLQPRRGPRFVAEALEEKRERFGLHLQVSNRLDGDGAVQLRVAAEIHESHGAGAEEAIDRITTYLLGDALVHRPKGKVGSNTNGARIDALRHRRGCGA